MVNDSTERRHSPSCNLERIKHLAEDEAVVYGSSRVEADIGSLGYSFSNVCDCLRALEAEHFSHAERYGPSQVWLDVYKISMTYIPSEDGSREWCDPLYIKLKLDAHCVTVVLCSFHRERN